MSRRIAVITGLAGLAIALAGCSASSFLPEPTVDPTRYFVLSSSAPASGAIEGEMKRPAIRARLEVASYARTRSLIVRRGENEVEFRDFARWGEPLEQGIARVLREGLLARGVAEVGFAGQRSPAGTPDYELMVRVLACEGLADGGVNFRATWELAPIGEAQAQPKATGGDFRASGLAWDGRDEATLAAKLSEAIDALATEIAGALTR